MRGTTTASDLGFQGYVAEPVNARTLPPRPPKIGQDSERARAGTVQERVGNRRRRGGRRRGG